MCLGLIVPRACRFAHLRHPGGSPPLHLGWGHFLDVLRQSPAVAEWVLDLAIAISPELVLERHLYLRPCFHSAIEQGIDVFAVNKEIAARRGIGSRSGCHARKLVAEHQT